MSDILKEVAEVADEAERTMVLNRIEALLKLYPHSPFLFLIPDGPAADAEVIVPFTNTDQANVWWMVNVVGASIVRAMQEQMDAERE